MVNRIFEYSDGWGWNISCNGAATEKKSVSKKRLRHKIDSKKPARVHKDISYIKQKSGCATIRIQNRSRYANRSLQLSGFQIRIIGESNDQITGFVAKLVWYRSTILERSGGSQNKVPQVARYRVIQKCEAKARNLGRSTRNSCVLIHNA